MYSTLNPPAIIEKSEESAYYNKNVEMSVGAELEFLPLTEVPLSRLSASIREALKPIIQLAVIKHSKPMRRQPKFMQLVQMIYIAGIIDSELENAGLPYRCKLNAADINKIKERLIKTAQKYDAPITLESPLDGTLINIERGNIEQTVLKLFDRLELCGFIQGASENCVNIGFDNSVHGTTSQNIASFEERYHDVNNPEQRFDFKTYSGLEAGFPVCGDVYELTGIYKVVVNSLKRIGVHFTKSSGVHLHVSVERPDLQGEEYLKYLANVAAVTAAASHAVMDIIPPTRRNNNFCLPIGARVDEHLLKRKNKADLTQLGYVQRKINQIVRGIMGDEELLADKEALSYEFALALTYGCAPMQHEFNYQEINKYAASAASREEFSSLAANIVRNPRYFACSPAPMLKEKLLPTFEWRILPSTGDVELQSNWFVLLSRIIESASKYDVITIKTKKGIDYLSFVKDGIETVFTNTIDNWLLFTQTDNKFNRDGVRESIDSIERWSYFDGRLQTFINSEENESWYKGEFYTPTLHNHKVTEEYKPENYLDLHGILALSEALDINEPLPIFGDGLYI